MITCTCDWCANKNKLSYTLQGSLMSTERTTQAIKSIGSDCDTRESKKGFTEAIKGYSRNTQSSYPHKRQKGFDWCANKNKLRYTLQGSLLSTERTTQAIKTKYYKRHCVSKHERTYTQQGTFTKGTFTKAKVHRHGM